MTSQEFKTKVRRLPPPLRRLYLEFAKPAADLWRAIHDHGCDTCTTVPGVEAPSRRWCPRNVLLSKAWHPLQLMADSLEWFLLDGEMPGLYRDAYVKGDKLLEAID